MDVGNERGVDAVTSDATVVFIAAMLVLLLVTDGVRAAGVAA